MLRLIKDIIYQITYLVKNIFLTTFYKIKKLFVKERKLPTLPLARFNQNVNYYNNYWFPNNSSTYLDTERRWNTNEGIWISGSWNDGRWNTISDNKIQSRKSKIDNLYKDDD